MGALEQSVTGVQRGIVDDGIEQCVERSSELGPLPVAEGDQVRPVDGEIREPVRLDAFLFEQTPQPRRGLDLVLSDLLAMEICLLVRDQVERKLVAVLAEEATGEELVDVFQRKGVRAYEPCDVCAKSRRVAKPPHRRGREFCAAFRMFPV